MYKTATWDTPAVIDALEVPTRVKNTLRGIVERLQVHRDFGGVEIPVAIVDAPKTPKPEHHDAEMSIRPSIASYM
jgi:hypothetical protein